MEIKEFVLSKIREKGPYNDPSQTFLSGSLMDSFDFIEMLSAIEARYGVALDLSEHPLDDVLTAEGLARIVSDALKQQEA